MGIGHPPLTKWSDTDHSGPLVIATVLGLIYWLAPGVGQQAISFVQSSSFSWADGLYTGSMVGCARINASTHATNKVVIQGMGLAQALLLLVACSQGLGRSASVLNDGKVVDALRVRDATRPRAMLARLTPHSSTTQATSSMCLSWDWPNAPRPAPLSS